jgi:hypothetical protein
LARTRATRSPTSSWATPIRHAGLLQGIERRLCDVLELLRPGQLSRHPKTSQPTSGCGWSSIRSIAEFAVKRVRSISLQGS